MNKDKRVHRFKADYGLANYRKFYKKKYNSDISAKEYSSILRKFNRELTDLIVNESLTYTMPYLLFDISIKKIRRKPRIVDGKLVNPNPIDWKRTNELWEENEEAREKKLLVRFNNFHSSGYVFRVYCKKFKSKLKYRSHYKIKTNREFKLKVRDRIMDPDQDNYDEFLLYKT